MELKNLHREFIEKAQRPMTFGNLPISPKKQQLPIIAVDRWVADGGVMTKTYKFRRIEDKELFINQLFQYEREVQHNATITIDHDVVSLQLTTKDIGHPTELDKEYASFADIVYKDIVYCPDEQHTREQEFDLTD